jgi:predicted permease
MTGIDGIIASGASDISVEAAAIDVAYLALVVGAFFLLYAVARYRKRKEERYNSMMF